VAEIEAHIRSHPRTKRQVSNRKRKESKADTTEKKKTMLQHHFEMIFVTEHAAKRHIPESNVENLSSPHAAS
jgi:hypothetical protein